jgi:hypothetical protein
MTAAEKVDRARSVLKEIVDSAIDRSFEEHGIQAIIALTDSPISSLASAAGKRLPSRLPFLTSRLPFLTR